MLNLPAFSTSVLAALVLADFIILVLVVLAAGPVFITGRDAFGRRLESVSVLARGVFAVLLLAITAYFGAQAAAVWAFLPYFVDPGATVTEQVTKLTVVDDPAALADVSTVYWVTTENHRFGVTAEVYRNLAVGNRVEARYRPSDDTLYEITVVERRSTPSPSPRP